MSNLSVAEPSAEPVFRLYSSADRDSIVEFTAPFGNSPTGLKIRSLGPTGLRGRLPRKAERRGDGIDDLVHPIPLVEDRKCVVVAVVNVLRDDEDADLGVARVGVRH